MFSCVHERCGFKDLGVFVPHGNGIQLWSTRGNSTVITGVK